MKLGFVGIGRMGENMIYNLLDYGHQVVAHNRSPEPIKKVAKKGAIEAYTVEELIQKLETPRVIWLMVKSGEPVDSFISRIVPLLDEGDIIIDGGNSYFEDSERRFKELKKSKIRFLDCGTSGGMEGARHGACMMVGGEEETFTEVEELFKDMCVTDGYGYMGKAGAGHFVKMVHNGIEYGMMGAIAEGMNAIKGSKFKSDLDNVIKVYAHGSIIESRLVSWLMQGMSRPSFEDVKGTVPRGETEGEMEQLEKMAEMKVLQAARKMRVSTRERANFMGKLNAVMRNEFGGHAFSGDEKD